jgi:hypothetical protein
VAAAWTCTVPNGSGATSVANAGYPAGDASQQKKWAGTHFAYPSTRAVDSAIVGEPDRGGKEPPGGAGAGPGRGPGCWKVSACGDAPEAIAWRGAA